MSIGRRLLSDVCGTLSRRLLQLICARRWLCFVYRVLTITCFFYICRNKFGKVTLILSTKSQTVTVNMSRGQFEKSVFFFFFFFFFSFFFFCFTKLKKKCFKIGVFHFGILFTKI